MEIERRRRPRPLRNFAIGIGASLALGAIGGAVVSGAADVGLSGGVVVGVTLGLAVAIVFPLCVWWWRQLDEAAREAHKWAWWWGGSVGMAVGLVLMGVAMQGLSDGWIDAGVVGPEPGTILYRGAMGMLVCQMLGYGVAWAAWWLRRR